MMQQELSNLNIFELRMIGKKLGVKHPTALKKEALLNEIEKLQLGLTLPCEETRGRPGSNFICDKISIDENFILKPDFQIVKKAVTIQLIRSLKIMLDCTSDVELLNKLTEFFEEDF